MVIVLVFPAPGPASTTQLPPDSQTETQSEILGLRWTDFDFKRSVVLIQRSAVGKRFNKSKTEYSQDEVPIEQGFILELRKWQALCLDSEEHWLFPSPVTGRPYHADSIRTDYLVPTGLKLGLGRIGFHTFRHTYRAWLDETGAPVGVQQKLMRHAHVSTTMDQYGNASALAKRKANRATPFAKVCHSADRHSINKGNCVPVPVIGQFWTVAPSAQLPVTL
jgi:integrase